MKYTAYVFAEPGMDRPCFSHREPNDAQLDAFRRKGTKVYSIELDLSDFELHDGKLRVSPCRIA